jgi:preprotein translocase subunit SecG
MTLWSWEWWLAIGSMGLLMLVGLLLMVVILLQRGRGGGLAGAFGGAGGQSAFGTRAGDVFTKITAVMAILWVFLAGVSRFALEPAANQRASTFQSQEELDAKKNAGPSIGSKTSEEDESANTDDDAAGKTETE